MPMRNQKFKREWFVYSWYITGNLDINTKTDGLENCPPKAVGEGCCGEMSHDVDGLEKATPLEYGHVQSPSSISTVYPDCFRDLSKSYHLCSGVPFFFV